MVDFVDSAITAGELSLRMDEAVIGPSADLGGKTLIDSHIRQDFGVIVIAIKNRLVK